MAYMSSEMKQKIAPEVKKILKKYGMSGSLSVHNHSTLVLNLKSGKLDMIGNFNTMIQERDPTGNRHINQAKGDIQVNPYWYHEHFSGKCKNFLKEVLNVMNNGNHDNSDIQTDYFDIGWYVDVNVGRWNKPYEVLN